MKKYLMTMVMCIAVLAGLQVECVQDCCGMQNFYTSAFGGANWLHLNEKNDVSARFNPGYMGALAIGYKVNPYIITRFEIEGSYRYNSLDYAQDLFGNKYRFNLNTETISLFSNSYYDFNIPCMVTPYLGFGVGYSHVRLKIKEEYFDVKAKDNGIAFQFIAGAKTPLTEYVDLGFEYRFFIARSDSREQNLGFSLTYNY